MKSLFKESGLKINLEKSSLIYKTDQFESFPVTRFFEDSEKVYVREAEPKKELYYMYRYFEANKDKAIFEENDLEYDITVINNGTVGKEYIKTKGHYHALVPKTTISYPELYEVITGQIEYLVQTKPNKNKETDVVIIKAKKGDKIVIPPGFGHVSINVGETVAVSSNVQKRDLPAGSDYGGFEFFRGGAMYRTKNGWEKNPEYIIKSIRNVKPKEKPSWGAEFKKPLYHSIINSPKKFNYITHPQNYNFNDIWEDL